MNCAGYHDGQAPAHPLLNPDNPVITDIQSASLHHPSIKSENKAEPVQTRPAAHRNFHFSAVLQDLTAPVSERAPVFGCPAATAIAVPAGNSQSDCQDAPQAEHWHRPAAPVTVVLRSDKRRYDPDPDGSAINNLIAARL